MFEKKIKNEYLKLSKIAYGGEFYLELENYKLKEVILSQNSKINQVGDTLLGKDGSTEFYAYKNEDSGFVGNLFENIKTKELVIVYRGTERLGLGENVSDVSALLKDTSTDINLMTANDDRQFHEAWEFYKAVRNNNPNRKIVIVGQSLGGALAQIVAAKEYTINRKKVETYTFNAPGCAHLLDLYDCNLKFTYSFITNYSVMNDWCGMFGEHIGTRYLIPPIPINQILSDNTAEILNNILLTTHEGIFDYTEVSMGKVIKKPKDFNQTEGLSLWFFDQNNPMNRFNSLSEFITAVLGINVSSVEENNPNEVDENSSQNLSFIEKAQKFFSENIPENIQNSDIGIVVRTAADTIIQAGTLQTEKFMENLNGTGFMTALRMVDELISGLSPDTLNKAQILVKKMRVSRKISLSF